MIWTPAPRGPHDPHLGLALLHERTVRGETLWAYNEAHLRFLLDYVSADDRRQPNRNGSLASRLPRWMKLSRHRDAVVRALEDMLKTCGPGCGAARFDG